jgi:putative ATP-dependent endonuclease of OLD family
VSAKKEALRAAREEYPDLALPVWSSVSATASAMDAWERENPSHLEAAIVSDTHLFGFHSQRKLSGGFDYVLVSADLRAMKKRQITEVPSLSLLQPGGGRLGRCGVASPR